MTVNLIYHKKKIKRHAAFARYETWTLHILQGPLIPIPFINFLTHI